MCCNIRSKWKVYCTTATDVVGVLNGASRSAKKLGDNIWVAEGEILQLGALGSQWVHDLFTKELLTNYSTVQPVWNGTWPPSLEENVYMLEDLEFEEEKKIKAPVLNGIYPKWIKIRYLKASLQAGFIVHSHHQNSNIWWHPKLAYIFPCKKLYLNVIFSPTSCLLGSIYIYTVYI